MTRDIIQKPSYGGKQCEGPRTKTVNCKLPPCPGTLSYHNYLSDIILLSSCSTCLLINSYDILVGCQWTPWNYGSCSEPCGTGRRNRTRTVSVSQKFGGTCTGKSRELEYCNTNPCPGNISHFISNIEFLMIKMLHKIHHYFILMFLTLFISRL